jgi:DNA-binding response OmpR family regulator
LTQSLAGARILIVEDEPFIAFDLQMAVEEFGAIAIGPASTVAEALGLIAQEVIDGAILDVNLPDGTIGPVLDALPKGVSIVVQTGVGLPSEIRAVHPDVPVYTKPVAPEVLIMRVAGSLRR